MKKNYFLRAAVLLLALCTLTAGIFVGTGTMAKYIAAGTGDAEARVAKFSVKIAEAGGSGVEFATGSTVTLGTGGTANLFNALFKNTYKGTGANSGTDTVVGASSEKVVAPGTAGDADDFMEIWNESEVMVNVKVEVTAVAGIGGTGTLVPLQVKNAAGTFVAVGSQTAGLLDAPIVLYTANLAPGQSAADSSQKIPLEWQWIFDTTDTVYNATGRNTATAIDAYDTALGILARTSTVTAGFTIKITATQVD